MGRLAVPEMMAAAKKPPFDALWIFHPAPTFGAKFCVVQAKGSKGEQLQEIYHLGCGLYQTHYGVGEQLISLDQVEWVE